MDNIGAENEGDDSVTPAPRATPPEIFRPTTRINPSRVPSVLDTVEKLGWKVRETRQEKADRKSEQRRKEQALAEELRLNAIAEREAIEAQKALVRAEREATALATAEAKKLASAQAQAQAEADALAKAESRQRAHELAEREAAAKADARERAKAEKRAVASVQAMAAAEAKESAKAASIAAKNAEKEAKERALTTFWLGLRTKVRDSFAQLRTKIRNFFAQLRTRNGIKRSKKLRNALIVAVSASALVLIIGVTAFQYVRPTQGIKTAAGAAASVVAVTDKLTTVSVGDTVVVLLGIQPGGKETVLMGIVRSMNADTIFVSDNNTTWAVKPSQVKGHVWFTLPAAAAS